MGIEINPIEAIKSIIDNKNNKHLREGEYLDQIATEATLLANIWQELVNELFVYNIDKSSNDIFESHQKLWFKAQNCNAQQYSRLSEYFHNISSVLGKKYNNDMNSIVFHIGDLLNKRNLTKKLIEERLSSINGKVLFDKNNSHSDFNDIIKSVSALHKEAAALHIRAQAFKTK